MSPRGRPSRKQREREAQRLLERPPPRIAESRTLEVQPAEAGQRLDRLLATRLPELSRARIQQLIEQGHVQLAGRAAKPSDRPAGGARVEIALPEAGPAKLEPAELDLPVLFEDAHLLVIDKPAGIAVHPGAGVTHATVVHGLLHQVKDLVGIGGELRPGVVHRLDRETSGCLVVAKSEPALRGLQASFKARHVKKRYRALVHGAPAEQGEFDTTYGRHPVDRKRFSSRANDGRRAVTRWTVLGRGAGASWLDVDLLTGRTHQIRAHFADAGFPLVADKLYGGTKREAKLPEGSPLRQAAQAVGRQALHALSIELDHPITGARLRCEAPLPPELRAALQLLGIAS
jgi:23S rRNA pseudouridine1911/1915/1917 synthase